ncbi:MAG: hypothetical protein WC944_10775 [Candidatus Cloacimonadaceae bacterium]|jgi:hypothetical protein
MRDIIILVAVYLEAAVLAIVGIPGFSSIIHQLLRNVPRKRCLVKICSMAGEKRKRKSEDEYTISPGRFHLCPQGG